MLWQKITIFNAKGAKKKKKTRRRDFFWARAEASLNWSFTEFDQKVYSRRGDYGK